MKLHYDSETDSLYIDPNARPGFESEDVGDGNLIDLDADGNPVGIDIEHASKRLDLSTLETVALPTVTTKMSA
jgi:uncharacterized protein YuzE